MGEDGASQGGGESEVSRSAVFQCQSFLNNGPLCRSIGVSNFDVELLRKLVKIAKIKPAVNQVRAYIVTIGAIGLHGA